MFRLRQIAPLASQSISSLGNFAMLAVATNRLGLDQFGRFSLVYAVVLFVSQITRSAAAESSMIEGELGDQTSKGASQVLGAGFGLALIFGLGAFVVTYVITQSLGLAGASFAATLAVTSTDVTRYACFAVRPSEAVCIDIVWSVFGLFLVVLIPAPTAAGLLGCWALSAFTASCFSFLRFKRSPLVASVKRCIKNKVARQLVLDTLIVSAGGLFLLFGLSAFGGSKAVGEFRTSVLPFTWMQIVLAGAYIAVLRRSDAKQIFALGAFRWFIVFGCFAAFATALIVRAVPGSLGRNVLGSSWPAATSLAMVIALQYGTFWFAESIVSRLKVVATGRKLGAVRLPGSVLVLCGLALVRQWPTAQTTSLVLSVGNIVTGSIAALVTNRFSGNQPIAQVL
jgi:hypothetical protein